MKEKDRFIFNPYPNFKSFLSSNWWFLLLGFSKAFTNSEESDLTGSVFFDFLFFVGILLLGMFFYWAIRYSNE
jgi:hypothetical protein